MREVGLPVCLSAGTVKTSSRNIFTQEKDYRVAFHRLLFTPSSEVSTKSAVKAARRRYENLLVASQPRHYQAFHSYHYRIVRAYSSNRLFQHLVKRFPAIAFARCVCACMHLYPNAYETMKSHAAF